MQFDPDNPIIKLCAEGMDLEGAGKPEEASEIFLRAWNEATNDLEKFTAAHYVARHQKSVADKLKWDQAALDLAFKIPGEEIKGTYPSLYLNIGKCYEDLHDKERANEHYQLALSYTDHLNDDGYGKMIRSAIMNGIERVK